MNPLTSNQTSLPLRSYTWAIGIAWTVAIALSFVWNVYQSDREMLEIARVQARVAYEKDVLYRSWASMHGGVYAPVTDTTPPNPYLDVPERDITTPSGKRLTLVNPAYMTRQVHEIQNQQLGVRGHITSLKPIRPQNAPDAWEAEALRAFENGRPEVSAVAEIEDKPYLRLMRPLLVETSCLNCHAAQGYREGDIRGGISVAVPLEPLRLIERNSIQSFALAHMLLWMIGGVGIMWGSRRLEESERERHHAEKQLRFISSHDALTGLYNRAYFEQELERVEQSGKFPVSIVMADLDWLKTVNDSLGHDAGDELLKRAAQALHAALRAEDIVARVGGDEFAAVLPSTDVMTAAEIVERIKTNVARDNQFPNQPLLSLSIGVATAEQSRSILTALKESDTRMYAEKKTRTERTVRNG
ncbi:putative diguanylate cyclase DgcQ [Anaerolineae bacterium]|nr:putative diguanylate cyclase DgcQ [Anaerolineae bacterium]